MIGNPIKLRAYNKKTREMCAVLLICFVNKYVDVLPERNLEGGSQESWSFDDIELMQSTGIFGVDGKEFYEGDIITNDYALASGLPMRWQVVWYFNGYRWKSMQVANAAPHLVSGYQWAKMHAIGNIYQDEK